MQSSTGPIIATPPSVYIRVPRTLVSVPPPPGVFKLFKPSFKKKKLLPPTIPLSAGHIYVIQGPIVDISRYAGTTVDWVLKVAQLIFDPCGSGRLYTHTTDSAADWLTSNRTTSWRLVAPGDHLLPNIYEFESTGPISLSGLSERQNRSETSVGSASNSSAFSRDLRRRDVACVVTGIKSTKASHLIPKRLGPNGVANIMSRFCGAQVNLPTDIYDPRIGILLYGSVNDLVDQYEAGFFHVTGNSYILHNFSDPHLSVMGEIHEATSVLGGFDLPPLHLTERTLQTHNESVPLPPKGVFDWHYLQCVVKVFGTSEYKNHPNVTFFIHPFTVALDDSDTVALDDSEDNSPDNDEAEPPYPSYGFDQFLLEQGKAHIAKERDEKVAQWTMNVASDT